MSKSLFLVTSAIYTRFGVYDKQQRLQQTLSTLDSIKSRCDADIILLDAGQSPLSEEDKALFSHHLIDVVQFAEDPSVKYIQNNPNWDIVKSLLEILLLKTVFMALNKQPETLSKYSRIFKISGRYVLNNSFDYNKHLSAVGKVTVKKSLPAIYQTDHWVIENIVKEYYRQYMTRLWSFDTSLITTITSIYESMELTLIKLLNDGKFIDIERLMYQHLDTSLIEEFDVIGVDGSIAPNGVLVSD